MNTAMPVIFAGGYVDITPDSPMQLAGHGVRWKPWNTIHDRLEANAVLLRCGTEKIAFVQIDVLSAGDSCRRRILEGLRGRLGEAELLLTASHTHCAPNIDDRLPDMGTIYEDYSTEVIRRIVALLDRVLADPGRPVEIRYGESPTAHAVNRRAWCLRPVFAMPPWRRIMARHPNPLGPRDDVLRAFAIMAGGPRPALAGALWNFACHPVTIAGRRVVSADYPGDVRQALRQRAGADIPVVFLPGFAGDLRPNRVSGLPLSPYYLLHRIVNGPVFWPFSPAARIPWIASLTRAALAATAENSRPCADVRIHSRRRSWPMREWLESPVDDRTMNFHLVTLGEKLALVGVSAEPVIEYAAMLRAIFPGKTLVPVGYMDGICGYLPTTAMLAEGGMEVSSPGYSLGTAHYRDSITEDITGAVRSLAEAELSPDESQREQR
jgi:hypothetical protein